MKKLFILILLLFSLYIVNSNCTEESPPCKKFKSIFDPTCYKTQCIRNSNFTHIYEKLKEKVFGQDVALSNLRDIFKYKLNQQQTEPISIHLVGDNGIGKSLTSSILTEYLFKFHNKVSMENRYALLYQHGADYLAPRDPDEKLRSKISIKYIDTLKSKIVTQLKKCSNSIIYIDDFQQMMSEVFLSFEQYLKGIIEYNNEQISTKNAIFIFTSDLGSEDLTRNKNIHELKEFIHERLEQFSSNQINQHLQNIPFQSLNKSAFKKIIKRELNILKCQIKEIKNLEYDLNVLNYLSNIIWKKEWMKKMNGRGIVKHLIIDYVLPKINNLLEKRKNEFIFQNI
eukprot:gene10815-3433_t